MMSEASLRLLLERLELPAMADLPLFSQGAKKCAPETSDALVMMIPNGIFSYGVQPPPRAWYSCT